jgi:bifunctional non-homologous end joining protein LigD
MKLNDRYAKAGAAPAADGAAHTSSAPARRVRAPARVKASARGKPESVEFSHTDKVMFPEPGYTKADVLDYYRRVAPKLLPHLRNRPVTLERLPDGLKAGAPRFWQKNTPGHYPAWIPRVELPSEDGRAVQYALVNDEETLLYLVNQGALTFHVWFSRVGNLARPDFVLFDLDPGEASFQDVVTIAKSLHERLAGQDVTALVKTSGKSGLHILVPWQQEGGYDEARAWAMDHAKALVKELPKIATVERLKSKRDGRVYIDVIQNAAGHHAVPPYVLRATPGATVSTPLEWKELTPALDPKRFDLKSALKRFAKQKTDPMAVLADV